MESSDGVEIRTTVIDGGELGQHKGINAPGVELPAEALSEKDLADLRFGAEAGVDLLAVSFVRRASDLRQAREALREAGAGLTPIVAKLERPEALSDIENILDASDAIMVARGDLGLELPLERVPRVQKELTRMARAQAMPVIVATQVFESMRTEPRPTRAEVSDAANAVDDGVDAIMLAGETAVGEYPVRAVAHTRRGATRGREPAALWLRGPREYRTAGRPRSRPVRVGGDAGGPTATRRRSWH